jgi:subtilisin family serine protease
MRKLYDVRWMRVISFSTLLVFGKMLSANEPETVSWYSKGVKETWETNKQVAAFKTYGAVNISDFKKHSSLTEVTVEDRSGYNLIVAKKSVEAVNKKQIAEEVLQYISNVKPLFTIVYKHPSNLLPERNIHLDEQILVKFKQPFISSSALAQFAEKYQLKVVHQPNSNLPQHGNYTYIFALSDRAIFDIHPAQLAGKIYEENNSLIVEAHPNMLNMFEVSNFEIDGEAMASAAWHLGNQGQTIFCNNVAAEQLADTRITDVWNAGYTGQYIRVGIIDVHGFDYGHPDMNGQFLNGWNFIRDQELNANNFTASSSSASHGMAVSGIIAANGAQRGGAAGVAPNAKLVPFLVDLSDVSIIKAFQKAMQAGFDVDVLNCSFSGTGNNPLIESEIHNLTNYGRVRFGGAKGVVVVCSSGNDNKSDEQVPMYPAAYSEVISVTATTPEDKRKDISDKWNLSSAWAPNYGKKLHIGAPGICLPTTDFSGAAGYSTSNYITFSKTSSAAPVISGVVALLLSKNQALTSQEVKDKLAQQADKVGGYDYSYDALKPGHSKEMGFGRVNAFKAIEETPVGITEKTKTENSFTIAVENPVGSKLTINYDFSQLQQDVTLEIYDMEGKLHRKSLLYRHEEMVTIDVQDLSPGMYYSKLFNKEDELVQTVKFIKLW